MPRKAATPLPATQPPNPALVRARTEGIQLVSPLKPAVDALIGQNILTDEDYIHADALLARIKTARALWATKLSPIRGPIDKAITELKNSLVGVKALDAEVDGPLAILQEKVRGAMTSYKIEEARQIQEAQEKADAEAQRIRDEANRKAQQATQAKTPQLRAKLEQARADLEVKATQVETQTPIPVQGASSSTRSVQKVRISDPVAFVAALKAYSPRAGIYELGHPPLTILTHKTLRSGEMREDDSPLDAMRAEVSKIFSVQPGVVASWPGVEVFDDVIIASH